MGTVILAAAAAPARVSQRLFSVCTLLVLLLPNSSSALGVTERVLPSVQPPPPPLAAALQVPVRHRSYMFECNSTWPYVHNGMLEILPGGIVAGAFQAGASEGSDDQTVLFALSFDGGTTWEPPSVVTPVGQAGAQWAPILRFDPVSELLWLYFVADQQLFAVVSDNFGQTWSAPSPLHVGRHNTDSRIVYTCNKAVIATASSGVRRLILPFDSVDPNRAFLATSNDGGWHWSVHGNLSVPSSTYLEPAVAATGTAGGGGLLMSLRASDGNLYTARSEDGGSTWTVPEPKLAAADTKTSLWSFGGSSAGLLLSYNVGDDRTKLVLDVSYDGGETFVSASVLEDGSDGLSHCYPTTVTNGTHSLTAYSEYNQSKTPLRVGIKVAITALPL